MRQIIRIILMAVLISCQNQGSHSNVVDAVMDSIEIIEEEDGLPKYLNSVKGHKEERVIVGNFTGLGIDTIYVVKERIDSIYDMLDGYKFYAKSNNPALPKIELFGCGYATPKLVYEGDVDGDGKDEWGYLQTWLNSQWRQYRIYNYDSKRKKWRHLYYDIDMDGEQLLSTPEYVRASGVDIVENGPKPGLIKINYVLGVPNVIYVTRLSNQHIPLYQRRLCNGIIIRGEKNSGLLRQDNGIQRCYVTEII